MDTALSLSRQTLSAPRRLDSTLGELVVATRGWESERRNNEDALLVGLAPDSAVLAVADGAGGAPSGAEAASIAISALGQELGSDREEIRLSILDGFEAANRSVIELGVGAATTLSAVELRAEQEGTVMRSYHVGDSAILVIGGRGKLKFSTISHSPVGYGVEAGLIKPEDALHHEDLNLVSNMVGMKQMRIEVGSEIRLAQRDTVLLGSDGLFDNLRTQEIIKLVCVHDLEEAAAGLLRLVAERMQQVEGEHPSKPDDTTFALFRGGRGKAKVRRHSERV
jgi:serine/threonine protein phosphatase PrpC